MENMMFTAVVALALTFFSIRGFRILIGELNSLKGSNKEILVNQDLQRVGYTVRSLRKKVNDLKYGDEEYKKQLEEIRQASKVASGGYDNLNEYIGLTREAIDEIHVNGSRCRAKSLLFVIRSGKVESFEQLVAMCEEFETLARKCGGLEKFDTNGSELECRKRLAKKSQVVA